MSKPTTNNLGTHPAERHVLTAGQARQIIAVAAEEATAINVPMNIAVVDPAGLLIGFLRMDNAFPGSIDLSQRKARTVALFNGVWPTAELYALAQPGAMLYGVETTNQGLVVFGGGVPVIVDGVFLGAVGVSGGSDKEDVRVATAGVRQVGGTVKWEVDG